MHSQSHFYLNAIWLLTVLGVTGKSTVATETNWALQEIREENVSQEEYIDDETFSVKEILFFFESRHAKLADQLKFFLKTKKDKATGLILEQAPNIIREYKEITETHGRQTGKQFLELIAVKFELERINEFRPKTRTAENREKFKNKIKQLVSQKFTLQLELEKAEFKLRKSELKDFELELQELEENREEIIDEQFNEILEELEEEEEEEEEESHLQENSPSKMKKPDVAPISVTLNDWKSAAKLDFQNQVLPLFQAACFDCHKQENNEADLDLESLLNHRPLVQNRRKWIHVYEQTRNHVMPPPDAERLIEADRRTLVAWIYNEIFNFDYSKVNHPGFEPTRRLSHHEYANTIRDLLNLNTDVFSKFPSDLSANRGFDNSSNSLFVQPLLMERYIQIAEYVADTAAKAFSENTNPGSPFFIDTSLLNPDPETYTAAFQKKLESFLPKAFRRSVTAEEILPYQKRFNTSYTKSGDFMASSKRVLQAILISPHFLLRVESHSPNKREYRINDSDLANRLSYFLWSSMPDNELFQLAQTGQLKSKTTLKHQLQKMLNHPKSSALGDIFASQWLGFQHLGTRIRADPIDNPWCTDSLMAAMKKESAMFFHSVVRENRPVRELLTADYTFVNEELAKHYRLTGIKGKHMRRVNAPRHRGGILGHASILAITSYPYQTSPVKRGTWVLTNLLGTPPPPPPPGASELEETIEHDDSLTFRQKLKRHSTNSKCSSCHSQIDPLGFGLENFDWFGRYRRSSRRVDSSGRLPDGTHFNGLDGLNRVLAEKQIDAIARNVVRKLLAFALARQLEYYDEKTVMHIMNKTKPKEYPLGDIILEIAASYPFLYKRNNDFKALVD
ncbi:MAG: DUF1592 domain-containing protein [Planctomycetota bacterium]|nr:DUF1592 domain-containing protein [Planctomycetota bacterium]